MACVSIVSHLSTIANCGQCLKWHISHAALEYWYLSKSELHAKQSSQWYHVSGSRLADFLALLPQNIKVLGLTPEFFCLLILRLRSHQSAPIYIFNKKLHSPAVVVIDIAGRDFCLILAWSWPQLKFLVDTVCVTLQLLMWCLGDLSLTQHSELHDLMSHNVSVKSE